MEAQKEFVRVGTPRCGVRTAQRAVPTLNWTGEGAALSLMSLKVAIWRRFGDFEAFFAQKQPKLAFELINPAFELVYLATKLVCLVTRKGFLVTKLVNLTFELVNLVSALVNLISQLVNLATKLVYFIAKQVFLVIKLVCFETNLAREVVKNNHLTVTMKIFGINPQPQVESCFPAIV
jgi:hypothetical protein